MRPSSPLVKRIAFNLTIAGTVIVGGTVICLAQKPEASQVEFDPSAVLPMDIMKGTKPATMADTQFVGEETPTFVAISPDSNGRQSRTDDKLEVLATAQTDIPTTSTTPPSDSSKPAASSELSKAEKNVITNQGQPVSNASNSPAEPVTNKSAVVVTSLPDSEQPVSGNTESPVPIPKRSVRHIDGLAVRLVEQSRDAWLRGLMDQDSYEAWLDLAASTQLQVAKQQGNKKRVLQILKAQVALWAEATAQLEEFDQPAAYRWKADLAHSRVMVLRAQLRYSVAAGHTLSSTDQQAYQILAAQHLDARLAEFQTGIGTAASVLAAARMVDEQLTVPELSAEASGQDSSISVATFKVEKPVAIRSALNEILRPVHLETHPQAISTRDLAEDRAAIRRTETFVDFIDTPTDDRKPKQFLSQLNQHSAEIAVRQFARFQTGTTSPGNMLREWWVQESIAGPLADQFQESTDFYTSQTRRLEGIHQLTMSLSDLRGRNSADIAAADLLMAARQLDLEPLSSRKKTALYDEAPRVIEAQVIEYGENAKTIEPNGQ